MAGDQAAKNCSLAAVWKYLPSHWLLCGYLYLLYFWIASEVSKTNNNLSHTTLIHQILTNNIRFCRGFYWGTGGHLELLFH